MDSGRSKDEVRIPEPLRDDIRISIARAKAGNPDSRHYMILSAGRSRKRKAAVLTCAAQLAADMECRVVRFSGMVPDAHRWIEDAGHDAFAAKTPLVLILDELGDAPDAGITEILMGLHRCNQERLPVVMVTSGSRKVLHRLVDARSYGDRIFTYVDLAI